MDFQLKIEILLCHIHPSPFDLGDKLVLYTLLARLCDATDLTDTLQWFHVLRSLLTTYATLCVTGCYIKLNAAIAKGMRQWFLTQRPLHVGASEREACMNRLMFCIANELKQIEVIPEDQIIIQVLDADFEGRYVADSF